jgi:hypothetical protein
MFLRDDMVCYDLSKFFCFELLRPEEGAKDWRLIGVLPRKRRKRKFDTVVLVRIKEESKAKSVYSKLIDALMNGHTLYNVTDDK